MRFIRTVLAVSALAALASGCGRESSAQTAERPDAAIAKVATYKVVEAPTPVYLTLTGSIVADDSSDVAADGGGKVIQVLVERGQVVKPLDPLVKLDTRSASIGAEEARAYLAQAEAQRKLAEDECARSQALYERGAIAKSIWERDQAQCTAAVQSVAAAQARVRMAGKTIGDGVVRAPFAGVIAETFVSPGEFVGPGARLVTLVDVTPLKLELAVPEASAPHIKPSHKVELEVTAFPDKTFHATVDRLGVQVGMANRAMTVEAIVDDGAGALVPGMFAEARIAVGEEGRPVIPRAALRKAGSTWRAFVVVDGALEERVVQLGADLGDGRVAIVKGVVAGDSIAAAVTDETVDGLRVR